MMGPLVPDHNLVIVQSVNKVGKLPAGSLMLEYSSPYIMSTGTEEPAPVCESEYTASGLTADTECRLFPLESFKTAVVLSQLTACHLHALHYVM